MLAPASASAAARSQARKQALRQQAEPRARGRCSPPAAPASIRCLVSSYAFRGPPKPASAGGDGTRREGRRAREAGAKWRMRHARGGGARGARGRAGRQQRKSSAAPRTFEFGLGDEKQSPGTQGAADGQKQHTPPCRMLLWLSQPSPAHNHQEPASTVHWQATLAERHTQKHLGNYRAHLRRPRWAGSSRGSPCPRHTRSGPYAAGPAAGGGGGGGGGTAGGRGGGGGGT